jgi:hypothetical protein
MLGATTYLYDVEHRGGGFCFWPRTHLPAWRFFAEHAGAIAEGGQFDAVVGGAPRARSHSRVVLYFIHFKPESLT